MADQAAVRRDLAHIFRAALQAVAPDRLIPLALRGAIPGSERIPGIVRDARAIYVLAVGKAAHATAGALEASLGPRLRRAVAMVPRGAAIAARPDAGSRIEFLEASHPVPDESSVAAARAALNLAREPGPGDLLIVAISGGASAMLAMPAGAVRLEDKIAITSALLRAGAPIRDFNLVRKHISAIKGGRLLRAVNDRTRVLGLIISDVPGNDPATIASGLTAADPTTYAEAIGVLKRRPGLWGRTPEPIREHLELGTTGQIDETVKPNDPALARVTNVIIGDNGIALEAAARAAGAAGYTVDQWRELRGDANDLGRALAAHLCAIQSARICVIAGGEPVVTVAGGGRGGRAQQCALAIAIELARIGSTSRIATLLAGSDGIDGPTDAAGAFAAVDTVGRAAACGIDAELALKRNDSYRVFEAIGDLLVTGPTGTNVADIFVGLVNY